MLLYVVLLSACSRQNASCNCNSISSATNESSIIDYVKEFEKPINYAYKLSNYNLLKTSPEFDSMSLAFHNDGTVYVSWTINNGETSSSSFSYRLECEKEIVVKGRYKYSIYIHYSDYSGNITRYFDFSTGYAWELSTFYDKIEYTGIGRDSDDELQNGAKSGDETATFVIDKSITI